MTGTNKLPPIIQDWLHKLNDPTQSQGVRDNYYMNLDYMTQVVNKGLEQYRINKSQQSYRRK